MEKRIISNLGGMAVIKKNEEDEKNETSPRKSPETPKIRPGEGKPKNGTNVS